MWRGGDGHMWRGGDGHVLRRALSLELKEQQRVKGRAKRTWKKEESVKVGLCGKDAPC